MPPKGARLSSAEVGELSRAPVGARSAFFSCRGRSSVSPLRLAVTAPKKIWPKSVDRNRVRRRVREAFRSAAEKGTSGDVLVVCAAAAAKTTFPDLVEAARQALSVYNR